MIRERPACRGRAAFTLIELLVVIAIIAILLSLAAAGAFRAFDASRRSTTETILQAVDQLLHKAWDKVVADAKREPIPPAVLAFAGNDANRARVIWIKLRLMEAFPQSFVEISNPLVYATPPNPQYPQLTIGPLIPPGQRHYLPTYQQKLNQSTLGNNNPLTQSSACLLLALSEINRGGGTTLRPDQFRIGDTDGDGLPEFLDGWGNPLFFVRFATGNGGGLQSAFPTTDPRMSQYRDPLDPDGWLARPWSYQTQYQQLVHPVSPTGGPPTFYVAPVLFSAGRDGQPGVDNFLNVTNPTQEQDNIYSFNLKLGRSD
jgi:prepilin-type N-terminal cleavage/methylation domain-containing protein